MTRAALAATLLVLVACGKGGPDADDEDKKPAAASENGSALSLTAEQVAALGLVTARLEAVSYRERVVGYGQVLALDVMVQTDADIVAAEAAAAQSAQAAARAKELYAGDAPAISREALEQAVAKAAVDQTMQALARRKAIVTFGPNAPWRNSNEQRTATVGKLLSGSTVLVKVTFPPGTVLETKAFSAARIDSSGKRWETISAWEAPADAAIPGRSLFALIDGSDLVQGERIVATVATGAVLQGVHVPATALVLGKGELWVYVKQGDSWQRVRVDNSRPDGDGYFVAAGLEPEQLVVTAGAAQLYAREINPGGAAED